VTEDPTEDPTEDRTRPLPVVALLTVDAALLAMMELFFLTLAIGQIPLPVYRSVRWWPW